MRIELTHARRLCAAILSGALFAAATPAVEAGYFGHGGLFGFGRHSCSVPCCDSCPSTTVTDALTDEALDDPLADMVPSPGDAVTPDLGITEQFGALTGSTFAIQNHAGNYIDNAFVGNQLRFRFDAAYDNPLPDRAEFFYAMCGCFRDQGIPARGPAEPEISVDYQEYRAYAERLLTGRLSAFVELPFREINPVVNPNTGGLSDIRTGFKYALINNNCRAITFQLKVYTPTGDADRGLGTGHASLEPGVLYYEQLTNRLSVFGEVRDWIPLSDAEFNGQNYAGNIIRYGLGTGYDIWQCADTCGPRRLTAVAEFVGWSVLDGLAFDGRTQEVLDVAGDTIVNAKVGMRYTSGAHSVSAGYGRGLTGDVWYEDIVRVEYRQAF